MSETLSVQEAVAILEKGAGNVIQIDNDPFTSVSYLPTERYYKDIRDKDLGDPHYGMPIEHPPKRDRFPLPRHIESVRFERGDPDNQYDPDYLILTPVHQLDKVALSVAYSKNGFYVHPEPKDLKKYDLCVHVRKPYSNVPVLPDIKIYDALVEFKLDNNLDKLIKPLNFYFEKTRHLEQI